MKFFCKSPPEPPPDGSGNPSGAPPPYQVPKPEDLSNDWSMPDPDARGRIVGGLLAMAKPNATSTRILPDGRTITTKVKRRDALRAMELAVRVASLNFQQKKDDHQANPKKEERSLNDFNTPVAEMAGKRMTEEARRQGFSHAAALDKATKDTIYEQVKKEYESQNRPQSQPGSKTIKPTAPGRRQDWPIPLEGQRDLMARLQDMTDPQGLEYHLMRDRERLRAVRILLRVGSVVLAQVRWDRKVDTGGAASFDWEEASASWEQRAKEHLAWRRRDQEEFERRKREKR